MAIWPTPEAFSITSFEQLDFIELTGKFLKAAFYLTENWIFI